MAHFQEKEEDPFLYHLTTLEPVGAFSKLFFFPLELLSLYPSTIYS